MKRLAALILAALAWTGLARADSLDTLGQFLQNTRSARAEFTQTVQLPPRDGQAQRPKISSGLFSFQRPSRFRFEYQRPYPQVLVGDGTTLWVYDVDLAQVTARAQEKALASTPVALIAAATDLAALQRDFQLQAQPEQDVCIGCRPRHVPEKRVCKICVSGCAQASAVSPWSAWRLWTRWVSARCSSSPASRSIRRPGGQARSSSRLPPRSR